MDCTAGHPFSAPLAIVWCSEDNITHPTILLFFFPPTAVDKTDARRPYVIKVVKLALAAVRLRTALLSHAAEFSDVNWLHREECVGKYTDLRLFDTVVPHSSLFSGIIEKR